MRDLQISGGPGWIKTEGFDVEARPASPVSRDKMEEMLRMLLAERFQLKVHTESRNLPAFALVLSDKGSKLQPATGVNGPADNHESDNWIESRMSMAQLAQILEFDLDRPVIDRTGLTGDFSIHWNGHESGTAPPRAMSLWINPAHRSLRLCKSSSGSSWNRPRLRWTCW